MLAERAIIFYVEYEMSMSLSLSLLDRFGKYVGYSSPVFIAIVFFFDLGCMLVNWGRLLILL